MYAIRSYYDSGSSVQVDPSGRTGNNSTSTQKQPADNSSSKTYNKPEYNSRTNYNVNKPENSGSNNSGRTGTSTSGTTTRPATSRGT